MIEKSTYDYRPGAPGGLFGAREPAQGACELYRETT